MGTKLTSDDIVQRLSKDGRGITLIGDFVTIKTNTLFQCTHGHQWLAMPYKVTGGTGCPICRNINITFTSADFMKTLIEDGRGIKLIGEYINAKTKTEFGCSYGHRWLTTPDSIKRGTSCPYCSGYRYSLADGRMNARLLIDGRGFTIVGPYKGTLTKTTFQCSHGHEWGALPNNVLSGSGCSVCSSINGIRTGFDPAKPASIYVLKFANFIKYGISNNLSNRLTRHKKNGDYTLVYRHDYDDGRLALAWENYIKRTFGGKYVNKDECPDGYTETLPIDLLETIINQPTNQFAPLDQTGTVLEPPPPTIDPNVVVLASLTNVLVPAPTVAAGSRVATVLTSDLI